MLSITHISSLSHISSHTLSVPLGWSNSDYWNDQIGSIHPHFPRLCQFITSPTCEEWVNITPNDRVSKFVKSIQKNQQQPSSSSSSSWNMSLFLGTPLTHRHSVTHSIPVTTIPSIPSNTPIQYTSLPLTTLFISC